MSARRFLTTHDVYNVEERDGPTPILDAFQTILEGIVTPILAEVYTGMDGVKLINVTDVTVDRSPAVLEFTVTGHWKPSRKDYELRGSIRLGHFMSSFQDKRQQILAGVTPAVTPTLRDDLLEHSSLSSQQFLVTSQGIDVTPELSARVQGDERLPGVMLAINVVFRFTIEDISTLEPGGEEMIRLRLQSLCSPDSRYPLSELQDWAHNLGITSAEVMTREELYTAVRDVLEL